MVNTNDTRKIPSWLSPYLRPAHLSEIAAAVRQVEVVTSGEVVPMVVRRSSVTGHVFPLAFLGLGAFYAALEGLWVQSAWHSDHWLWAVLELGALIPLAWWLSKRTWAQRFLTATGDLRTQVLRRAEAEFYQAGLQKTGDSTGILIFVSIEERQAVVLADRGIAAKIPQGTWDEVVAMVIASVKNGGLGKGLAAAVARCGVLLAPHFPIQDHDRNELADALVIKD